MGGWDSYCAFCAGPFSVWDPFLEEMDDGGSGYDRSVISAEGVLLLLVFVMLYPLE